ncbi:MAG: uroporphyrinogen decarboxylase family protein [Armatimonadota bacterium]
MTPRERILMALRHEEPDFVPYTVSVDEEVAGRLDAHYGTPDWRKRIVQQIASSGVDLHREQQADGTWKDAFGCVWMDLNIFHTVDVPLKEPTLAGYELPELLPDDELEQMRERLERAPDLFRHAGIGMSFFERSWALRGFEDLMADFAENPKFIGELFDALMELHLPIVDRLCTLPVDCIRFGDDFGAQRGVLMGTTHWREVLKPRLAQMYGRAHEHGRYVMIHSCGDNSPIIEDLIEIGVDIFNPFQPEAQDVYAMKREYGRYITFNGGIGTQELLPRGTPEQITAEVERLCEEIGAGGGFILGTTKPILPDVPTENAVACFEAIVGQGERVAAG